MRFNTDDIFLIGENHIRTGKPCQDYARSGTAGKVAYAIVSDGCSTGGETDIGARLIGLSTAESIRLWREFVKSERFGEVAAAIHKRQRGIIKGTGHLLGVSTEDMLATASYAVLSKESGFVNVRGDGVVAVVERDGKIYFHRFDWENNMPFYPAYSESPLFEAFVAAHGGDASKEALSHQVWCLETNGNLYAVKSIAYSITQSFDGVTIPVDVSKTVFVAVFSDGVCQVDGLDWKDATQKLLAFKTLAGVFVKRRMMRFVKDAREIGKGPLDDIACAVIHIEHEA